MKISEFILMDEKMQVKLVNERLSELARNNLTDKDFKSELLSFSYTQAANHLKTLGYERYDDMFIEKLTAHDVMILKDIASRRDIYTRAYSLGASINLYRVDEVQATTVRVYRSVWEDWNTFCKEKSAISKEELLTVALESFMKQYR